MTLAMGFHTLQLATSSAEPPPPKKPMSAASTPATSRLSLDPFTRSLYAQLARQPGNLTVSPASIDAALLLALAGAKGDTADEIASVLKLSEAERADLATALAQYRSANSHDKNPKDKSAVVTIANSAWVQQGFPIVAAYRKLLETSGGASFHTVDFARNLPAAIRSINQWVDESTRHKISELLTADAIDSSARLVLANAIYFRGKWQQPFSADGTQEQPFHRPGAADVTVPLMHLHESLRYLETETYQAIELAYEGTPHAMIVWLPKQVDGLAELERRVVYGNRVELEALQRADVNVFLPKFKIRSNVPLKEVLQALGMKRAFTDAADFSGISNEPLLISAVVHQALVEVDETGTEAAAATAVIVAPTAAPFEPDPPKLFRADHPFLFAIRNATTGETLFVGRVENPAE
jgi:serpin B